MEMQLNGVLIDQERQKFLHDRCTSILEENQKTWSELLGYDFNPGSSQQTTALYEKDLNVQLGGSADKLHLLKAVLREPQLEHITKAILQDRDLVKLRGTYLTVEPSSDGRLRSDWRAYGTVTWRLSSRDPDLQNLPRDAKQGVNIKDIYISPPGRILYSRDYSQLEYRIPAYASRSRNLVQLFQRGEDVHLRNARLVFKRQDITKKERTTSKTVKYAEGYGGAPPTVSDQILKATYEYIDPKVIAHMLAIWRTEDKEMYDWLEQGFKDAVTYGVLYDGFGVPRHLYGRPDDRRGTGLAWPTAATASGIMNRSMVRIHKANYCQKFDAKLVMQVHDELLFEVPDPIDPAFDKAIKEAMEYPVNIFGVDCMFPTDVKVGYRYSELKDIK
jgi:DNA polymerase-1